MTGLPRRSPGEGGSTVDVSGPRHGPVFTHEAMATIFEIHIAHADRNYAAQAAHAAFDLTDRLERELSRFLPNSDITRINRLAPGASTRVSATTMECLVIARAIFELTGGAFDPSLGTGMASIDLDEEDFVVRATIDGVRLDLGAIGKGYAVDLMAEQLEDWGLTSALVNGGFSSILALEPPPDHAGWPLSLSDPTARGRLLAEVTARQTALSASGIRKTDHIVDPHDGEPVRGRVGAWIALRRPQIGPEALEDRGRIAAVADALTTALMVMELSDIEALCPKGPAVEAWILEPPRNPGEEAPLHHFGGIAE